MKTHRCGDSNNVDLMLDPQINRGGRKTVVSATSETLIVDKLLFCSAMGFAFDKSHLKSLAEYFAIAQRRPFKNGVPSDEWIGGFRDVRRGRLKFRRQVKKEASKLAAESSVMQVESFNKVLERVLEHHFEIQTYPRLVWNMDETAETGECVEKANLLTSIV